MYFIYFSYIKLFPCIYLHIWNLTFLGAMHVWNAGSCTSCAGSSCNFHRSCRPSGFWSSLFHVHDLQTNFLSGCVASQGQLVPSGIAVPVQECVRWCQNSKEVVLLMGISKKCHLWWALKVMVGDIFTDCFLDLEHAVWILHVTPKLFARHCHRYFRTSRIHYMTFSMSEFSSSSCQETIPCLIHLGSLQVGTGSAPVNLSQGDSWDLSPVYMVTALAFI